MRIKPSHVNFPEFNDLAIARMFLVNRKIHSYAVMISQVTDEEAAQAIADLEALWNELQERTEQGHDV